MLQRVLPVIRYLSEGNDLSREEARAAFDAVIQDDKDSYYFFALTLAMHTKGETANELLGLCDSLADITPQLPRGLSDRANTIDVSGTGGDVVKTFNVSTAVAFVLASAGLRVAKQAFFAVTGFGGSADLLASFGVMVPQISCNLEQVAHLLKETGIVTYHLLLNPIPDKTKGLTNWVKKRQEIGLNFVTPFHLAGFAYSPIPMDLRLYGVYDARYVEPLAKVFAGLGFRRVMVVHGSPGIDEISVVGETSVCEFSEEKFHSYTIRPEDFGIRCAKESDIRATSADGNLADFLRVLYGVDTGPKADMVAVNAGAGLYLAGQAENFKAGAEKAATLVRNGTAAGKLEEYVCACGDVDKLKSLKELHQCAN